MENVNEVNCDAGDIVRIMGDTLYDALIVRKEADQYEVVILDRLHDRPNPSAQCKPGQMFVMKQDQIAAHINKIPLTVKQIDEEDHLDFDEEVLKQLGYELPQL